jgi:hypothetical protein
MAESTDTCCTVVPPIAPAGAAALQHTALQCHLPGLLLLTCSIVLIQSFRVQLLSTAPAYQNLAQAPPTNSQNLVPVPNIAHKQLPGLKHATLPKSATLLHCSAARSYCTAAHHTTAAAQHTAAHRTTVPPSRAAPFHMPHSNQLAFAGKANFWINICPQTLRTISNQGTVT